MELTLTNERLRELIPNIIHEVKGETPLLTKLQPWLDSAVLWLEDNFLGAAYVVPENIYRLAEKIAVQKAFAEAIPSLDVALSPAGFAVINTEGRAPASKERIERLVASLTSAVDANSEVLLSKLLEDDEWRVTPMGQWWLGTFIPTLKYAYSLRGQNTLLDAYRAMRDLALRFEQEVAENYLGENTLAHLREQQRYDTIYAELVEMMRRAELRYVSCHIRDQKSKCPDEHEVWHLIRPLINTLRLYPKIEAMWQEEMGERFKPEPFKNDIKGGYYF